MSKPGKIFFLLLVIMSFIYCGKKTAEKTPPDFNGIARSEINSTGTSLTLYWTKSTANNLSYYIYMGKEADSIDYSNPISVVSGEFSYTVENLEPNTTYFFAVTAKDKDGNSTNGNIYSAVTSSWKNFDNVHNYNFNSIIPVDTIKDDGSTEKTLWIGTGQKIIIFNYENNTVQYLDKFGEKPIDRRINELYKDSQGNIWIATQGNGLVKYNPSEKSWLILTHENTMDKNGNSLLSNNISTVRQDSNGVIWIGTPAGINKYISLNANWFEFTKANTDVLPGNDISSLAITANNNVWVGSSSNGIGLYNSSWLDSCDAIAGLKGSAPIFYNVNFIAAADGDLVKQSDTGLISKSSSSVVGNQKVWIATNGGGVSLYYGGNSKIKCDQGDYVFWQDFRVRQDANFLSETVNTIYIDNNNGVFTYWFGTTNGVNKFDGKNWEAYTKDTGALADNFIISIAKDSEGNLWFGSKDGGISKFVPAQNTWTSYSIDGPLGNNISVIYREPNSSGESTEMLWLGTNKGLTAFDPKNKTWKNYVERNDGLSNNNIKAIVKDSRGNKWIGTANGLNKFDGEVWIRYTVSEGLKSNNITALAVDRADNIWVGTDAGISVYSQDNNKWESYTRENTKNNLAHNHIYSIKIDSDNKWFGTEGGLNKFDGTDWITYTKTAGLQDNNILALEIDEAGIWVGTKNGVSIYNGTTWTKMGLSGTQVNTIVFDKNGNKWFGARTGLYRYTETKWISYTKTNYPELGGNEILSLSGDEKGNIWIGTTEGLTKFGSL